MKFLKFNIKTFLNYKFWEKFILFTSAIGAPFLTQGMIVDINSSGKEIFVYGWLTNSLIYLLMLSVSFYVFWIIQFVLLTIYNVIYNVFFYYIRIFISYCKSQGIKGILSKINCFFNAYSKWILLVTTIFGLVVLYFNNALYTSELFSLVTCVIRFGEKRNLKRNFMLSGKFASHSSLELSELLLFSPRLTPLKLLEDSLLSFWE